MAGWALRGRRSATHVLRGGWCHCRRVQGGNGCAGEVGADAFSLTTGTKHVRKLAVWTVFTHWLENEVVAWVCVWGGEERCGAPTP